MEDHGFLEKGIGMRKARQLLSGASSVGIVGGLAGAAAMTLSPAAQAELVVSWAATGTHTAVNPADTGTFGNVRLDLDGDAAYDVSLLGWSFGAISRLFVFYGSAGASVAITDLLGWGSGYAARFTNISAISGHAAWTSVDTIWRTYNSVGWSEWSPGQGLLGVRLDNGGGYDYYWIEITPGTIGTPPNSFAINGWSNSGGGSGGGGTAGGGPGGAAGTPEPAASGLALLALGAAGVMRKRRNQPVA